MTMADTSNETTKERELKAEIRKLTRLLSYMCRRQDAKKTGVEFLADRNDKDTRLMVEAWWREHKHELEVERENEERRQMLGKISSMSHHQLKTMLEAYGG